MDELLKKFETHLILIGYSDTHLRKLKTFCTFCKAKGWDLLTISKDNFEEYFMSLRQAGRSAGHISNIIKALKFFYRYLKDEGLVERKFLKRLKKFKLKTDPSKVKTYFLEEELDEAVRLFNAHERYSNKKRSKALFYFMFYTGLRINEVIKLKREHIDLEKGRVSIYGRTKNNEERQCCFYPCSEPLEVKNEKLNSGGMRNIEQVGDFLYEYFISEPERFNAFNLSRNQIEYLVKKFNKYIPKKRGSISPHIFRHSFAMNLVRRRVDPKTAQKLLGHKNIQSTYIYYNTDMWTAERIYRKTMKRKPRKDS